MEKTDYHYETNYDADFTVLFYPQLSMSGIALPIQIYKFYFFLIKYKNIYIFF